MRTLFDDAIVLTMDDAMRVHDRGHVLIEGDAIALVGAGPGPRGRADRVVECAGDIIMPAMVNPHAHLPMTLFRGLGEDVDDRLYRYVLPLERRFVDPAMVRVGTALAAVETIRAGIGTVADMYYYEEEVGRMLDAAGLRGVVGQTIADFDPPDHATIDEGFARFDALRSEFAGHPRITASLAPHAPYSTGPDVLRRCAAVAERTGAPVQIHLAEMASEMAWCAENHAVRPVALVDRAGLLAEGLIAAHCLYLNEAEIALIAERGVRVAHNARSNAKAGRGIAPVTALLKAGARVGIATDGPMSGNTLDLFAQFGPVAMFQKLAGKSRAPMPAAEIVRMATRGGAEVLGMDDRIGTLAPGMAADLTRVSTRGVHMRPLYDPYAALVFCATPADVRDLVVDGAMLLDDGVPRTVDEERAVVDAEAIAARFKAAMMRIDATIDARTVAEAHAR